MRSRPILPLPAALRQLSIAFQRGFDVGKKVNVRKHHIAVDTERRLLMLNLTSPTVRGPRRSFKRCASCGVQPIT
jgi:hypothetical protein